MGKSEKRNVTVFVVTGVLLAGGVGFGVWQMSSPAAPATTDTATTSVLSTTRAVDDPSTGENVDEVTEIGPADDLIEEASPSGRDDPFLAPNAVLAPAPEDSAPTTTYRPDNVVPLSTTYDDEPAAPAGAGAFGSEPSPEPTPVAPMPTGGPLEPETAPSSPVQPTGTRPLEEPETTPEVETPPETEGTSPEPTTQPDAPEEPADTVTPHSPSQGEPEPTATAPAEEPAPLPEGPTPPAGDGQGSGARPTPWERALSWLRG